MHKPLHTDPLSITESIRREYSEKTTVEAYARWHDVWPEEKVIFDRFFNNKGTILDIGCGTGRTVFYLAQHNKKIIGIDLSPMAIEAAKDRLKNEPAPIEFLSLDAQQLAYPDNFFDGIVFPFNGIENIPRTEGKVRLLKNIRRMLKPGGYFFFTAHNLWSIRRYFLRNVITFPKIFFARLLHFDIREKEYGEMYSRGPDHSMLSKTNQTRLPYDMIKKVKDVPYLDIKRKKAWFTMIRESGLQIEYFNSRSAINERREFSVWKDYFGEVNYFFFVCKK